MPAVPRQHRRGPRLYREALQVHPSFSECRHNLALALIEAGQPQDAERELRLLLRDQPGYFQAAFCLANLLRDHKRDPEAIEAFRLCLQYARPTPMLGTTLAWLNPVLATSKPPWLATAKPFRWMHLSSPLVRTWPRPNSKEMPRRSPR